MQVVQHNALHEDHGLVLKRPDETAFMQKLLELNYPGAVALQFCLGGMDLATLRTSNLTLQLLDSVNGIDRWVPRPPDTCSVAPRPMLTMGWGVGVWCQSAPVVRHAAGSV